MNIPIQENSYSLIRKLSFRLMTVATAAFLAGPGQTWGATKTWSGAGTDDYWNTGENWGGTAPVSGDALTFSGSNRKNNTNDITSLTIGLVTFSSGDWHIASTSPITKTNDFTQSATGTNVWAADTVLLNTGSAATKVTGSSYGARLEITGQLSGAGGLTKNNGANGRGSLFLNCSSNTFAGQPNLGTGPIEAIKFAPAGSPSSFGQGSSGIIIGSTGSGYPTTFNYVGAEDSETDRLIQLYTRDGTVPLAFNNNSPNNANLTFNGGMQFRGYLKDLGVTLGGTSAGTNTISSLTESGTNHQSLTINGPGTWVLNGLDSLTGDTTVNSGKFVLGAGGAINNSAKLTVRGGAVFDVDAVPGGFPLGAFTAQTLWVGYNASNTAPSDIAGSLSLGYYGTLNIGGAATAGTLGISSNLSLVSGGGIIQMDLGSEPVLGDGTNDLILVGGDLDISLPTTLSINPYQGTLVTGTPYTVITYGGNFIGDPANLIVPAPARTYSAAVSVSAAKELQVTFSPSGTPAGNLFWQGMYNSDWTAGGLPNWLHNGTNDVFTQGDAVTFSDDTAYTAMVNLVGSVFPSAMTVNTTNGFTLQGAGSLGGSATVTKNGPGPLLLSSVNTLSGTVVVSAGSLVAGNSSALGTSVVVLGDSNTGTNDAAFLFSGGVNLANAVLVSSNGTGLAILGRESGNSGGYNGPIQLQRSVCFMNPGPYSGNSVVLLNSSISGQGDITLSGGGFHKWQGSNSFSGDLTVNDDGTVLQSSSAFGIPDTTSVNIATGAVLQILGSEYINGLNGAGVVRPISHNYVLNVGAADGSGNFSGIFSNNTDQGFATIGVRKHGTGTQILSGDNSLATGNTTVSGGTLAINNTTGSGTPLGAITVQAAGILAGNGTVSSSSNNITVNGALSVGNAGDTNGAALKVDNASLADSPGTLVFDAGTLAVDLFSGAGAGDNTGVAAAADQLHTACPVQLNATSSLTVSNPNGMTAWAVGDKWKIIDWGSAPSGTFGTLNLPNLGSSLTWDTSALYVSGVIAVVTRPPTPPISYTFLNGTLTLTWPGNGVLQAAPRVTGVYTNVPGAASPFVITNFDEPSLFYRLYFPW